MFVEKLNKKTDGSMYVIEEKQTIVSGKYEGFLEHDNANRATLKVYTKSKLSGDEITNVIISIPANTPWKRSIKVFSDVDIIYITYETPGDTVEADDINQLQDVIQEQKEDFKQYKANGHISGGTF